MMRASVLDAAGSAFRVTAVERPKPAPGTVLVRIAASGVNPLDLKIRAGQAAHARHPLPAILGIDLAGTIEAIGSGVSAFRESNEVYGMTGGVGGVQGSLAEFAAVDAALLAPKPSNLPMREAAALPLILITAWEGLVDRAQVQAGQKVLIHGGAGGVGHIAIQLARASGAEVFATGSAANLAFIEQLGATPIDYRAMTVEDYSPNIPAAGASTSFTTPSAARRSMHRSARSAASAMSSVRSAGARMRWPRCRSAPHPIPECSPCSRY